MDKGISSGLKTTFLIHAIIALIFGLLYLLIPETLGKFIDWPTTEPEVFRTIGAAVLAFGASSFWCYRASSWEAVKIVVQTEIVWTVLATLVMLYGLLFANLPAFAWVNTILMGGFAAAFIVFYTK